MRSRVSPCFSGTGSVSAIAVESAGRLMREGGVTPSGAHEYRGRGPGRRRVFCRIGPCPSPARVRGHAPSSIPRRGGPHVGCRRRCRRIVLLEKGNLCPLSPLCHRRGVDRFLVRRDWIQVAGTSHGSGAEAMSTVQPCYIVFAGKSEARSREDGSKRSHRKLKQG